MKTILLISPDFPYTYWQFARAFKNNGMTVLAIGGTPYEQLTNELKECVDKYYCCNDMQNLDEMYKYVGWLINEFGPIDFLESNNEFWLQNDSKIREHFNIRTGLFPKELEELQQKSSMKKYFEKAGIKVAPYILVDDYESLELFAKKYGFPLFCKPDIGVGAGSNYKINNFEELIEFFNAKDKFLKYICEVFVTSKNITTFDGIANIDSEVVVCDSMVFPSSIFEVKKQGNDLFYYVSNSVDERLVKLGSNVIKEMGLKNRFFHIELFTAEADCEGSYCKGDYVGIEVNIRTPGGYTTDLINFGLSTNIYQIFADTICFNYSNVKVQSRYYSACASRRTSHHYFFNDSDIKRTYNNNICFSGDYPFILSDIMGDKFYMAKFEKYEDMVIFKEYVGKRTDIRVQNVFASHHLIGEDARIMKEKNARSDLSDLSICDKHIDGA